MKYLVILVLLVCATAFAFDGICPECKELGLKSTVTQLYGTTTLLNCGNGYWDEDGNYHAPEPCNTTTIHYECSQGHSWTEWIPSY